MTEQQREAFAERVPAGTCVKGCARVSIVVDFKKRGWYTIKGKRGILIRHSAHDAESDVNPLGYSYTSIVQFFEVPQNYYAQPRDVLYKVGTGRKKWLTFDQVMALPAGL